ncbi:hypothetical protein C5E51_28170 [Nocardia nova]|uniref:DUF3558 domain-containing protein n=1 Tax=Nocardia nova TaxID=37330 RepID=UPI000CEA3D2B|nr:DUF3558 domain-containing protein [Nocardia nova]PPJ03349.1 hypothetical protein C5E51_28170 [Nocardia nova]PPJ07427.1 hypothetical protein C5E44_29575 [Nocardia nova]
MKARVWLAAGCALATIASVSACSSGTDSAPGSTDSPSPKVSELANTAPSPTLTAPSLQPPGQDDGAAGRPKVVFDPCTWISDETVAAAGFNPNSRKRANDLVAEYTAFTCRFASELRSMDVDSTNISFEEDQQKNGGWLHPLAPVNGRDAAFGQDKSIPGSCETHLRTKAGSVFIRMLLTLRGRGEAADPCADMTKIAAAIEASIGKGN